MPHKRNPIICERVTGSARVLRGYAVTALENQALWHERDISHSSTERIIFPDATILLDYMFSKITGVIDKMQVNEKQMMDNIAKSYNIFYSQQLLLKIIEKGMLRETAYGIVQKNAMKAFDQQILFDDLIREDKEIGDLLSRKEIDEIFSLDKYVKNIDYVYRRVY